MNILSALQGVTTPVNEMIGQLAGLGWQLGKVDIKDGQYVAPATGPDGVTQIAKTGPTPEIAIANTLLAAGRRNNIRSHAMFKVGMWDHHWHDRQTEIAEAYRKAPIYDPKAVAAYKALGDDSVHRLEALKRHLHIEPTNDPAPYANADDMRNDIYDKKHYFQTVHGLDHPVWTPKQYGAFKAVHDILGHGVAGGDYGWHGANLATAAHAPLLREIAQQALFSEAVAKTAYHHVYGPGPHKIALFPDFIEHVQAEQNQPAHTGIHPSQVPPPERIQATSADWRNIDLAPYRERGRAQTLADTPGLTIPEYHPGFGCHYIAPEVATAIGGMPESGHVIHDDGTWDDHHWVVKDGHIVDATYDKLIPPGHPDQQRYIPYGESPFDPNEGQEAEFNTWLRTRESHTAAVKTLDPNDGWTSGIDALPQNAFLHHGDPLQGEAVMQNAQLIDTNWHGLDRDKARQAIVNAFRVVLLSPRKDLRWNAIHYQDIAHVPAGETDPKAYWDTLEKKRRDWNEAQGIDPQAHMIYFPFLKAFEANIYARKPKMGREWAKQRAERLLYRWWSQEQRRIEEEDAHKPADKQRDAGEIERRANEALAKRLKEFLKPKNDKTDFEDGQISLFGKATHVSDQALNDLLDLVTGPGKRGDTEWERQQQEWMDEAAKRREEYNRAPLDYERQQWDAMGHDTSQKTVGWVPTDVVREFKEYHRQPGGRDNIRDVDSWDNLKDHIRQNGFMAPVGIHFNEETGMGHLGEGNHRAQIAEELGLTHIPVQIFRSYRSSPTAVPMRLTPEADARHRDHRGESWLPDTMHPSDFGLPVRDERIAARPTRHFADEQSELEWAREWTKNMRKQPYLYHVSPSSNRAAILQHGLQVKDPYATGGYHSEGVQIPGVYVEPDAENAMHYWGSEDHDIWRIPQSEIKELLYDPEGEALTIPHNVKAELHQPSKRTAAGGQYNILTGEEALKYGAFMGTHLKSIAQISQHADEILDAAMTDVKEHDGSGHHFRSAVLALNVSGVGPKVCSFAWLLLQPMTSQLATIDTHMMDVLGHNYEKEMNNRDYFKFERELAAGRDASGYSHVPLGTFQWGMWDFKRTGAGSHQDHSAMRVLEPKDHSLVDWVGKAANLKGESWLQQAPDWWKNTQAARETVANEWDNTYGKNFPLNQIPHQAIDDRMSKTASEEFDYWWDREMPIRSNLDGKARRVAEYAAAKKLSKSELEDWLDDHKSDTELTDAEFKRFREKIFAKFNRINKHGSSRMKDLREQTGLSVTEIWQEYAEAPEEPHSSPSEPAQESWTLPA